MARCERYQPAPVTSQYVIHVAGGRGSGRGKIGRAREVRGVCRQEGVAPNAWRARFVGGATACAQVGYGRRWPGVGSRRGDSGAREGDGRRCGEEKGRSPGEAGEGVLGTACYVCRTGCAKEQATHMCKDMVPAGPARGSAAYGRNVGCSTVALLMSRQERMPGVPRTAPAGAHRIGVEGIPYEPR